VATIDWMVSDCYKRRHLPVGATLCHEGDFGDTIYFVVQGSLQISKRVIQGADKVIATLGVGQYAGELSLLTGAQRNATMRAVEETEVVEIDQEAFLQLIREQPLVGLDLMRQLAHRLHATTEELILTALEVALAQREPPRMALGNHRMRFIATGSFPGEKTAEVLRLAAAQAPLAHSPALVSSLIRPGRTHEALVYVLETDDPSDLLESLWKQNLYKTMLWFIYLAKLRTDLLDNRSLAILLETYKLLICYTLVFGQPLRVDHTVYGPRAMGHLTGTRNRCHAGGDSPGRGTEGVRG
jgi:CRP-like cAMP-binding protein